MVSEFMHNLMKIKNLINTRRSSRDVLAYIQENEP